MHAIRLAFRQFTPSSQPSPLVTVLVLGLGIGASVTVYSVVDAVLLRPLPYTAPDRLVDAVGANHEKGLPHEPLSPVNFMDYRDLAAFRRCGGVVAARRQSHGSRHWIRCASRPSRPARISSSCWACRPQVGPGFPDNGPFFDPTSGRDQRSALADALSAPIPRSSAGTLSLSGAPYTVVGVMPPRFDFPGDIDVWQRLRWDLHQHSRGAHFMEAVARLRPAWTFTRPTPRLAGLSHARRRIFRATNQALGRAAGSADR